MGTAELALPDAGQVGETEEVGLHRSAEASLEVAADGEALVLGDVGAARALVEVVEGQCRLEPEFAAPERVGATQHGDEAVETGTAERADARRVTSGPGDGAAVGEGAAAGAPGGPTRLPAAAEVVEIEAHDVEGQARAKGRAPGLYPALLDLAALVGRVEEVEVQEIIDGARLGREAGAALMGALHEKLVQLTFSLDAVRGARIGRLAAAGLAGELVVEPPPPSGLPSALPAAGEVVGKGAHQDGAEEHTVGGGAHLGGAQEIGVQVEGRLHVAAAHGDVVRRRCAGWHK